MSTDKAISNKLERRISIEYIGILGEYRAYWTDNEGEGPYGTGLTERKAVEDLYHETWEEEQRAKEKVDG